MPRMAIGLLLTVTLASPTGAQEPAAGDRLGPPAGPEGPAQAAALPAPPALSSPPTDPWASPEIAPHLPTRPFPRSRVAAQAAPGATAAPSRTSWLRSTLALGLVVSLMLLLAWGYRATMGKLGPVTGLIRGRHAELVEVLVRVPLRPRQALLLVRIGPRLVLVGASGESIQALHTIEDEALCARLLGQAARGKPGSATAEFDQCLHHAQKTFDAFDSPRGAGPSPPTIPAAAGVAAGEPAPPGEHRFAEMKAQLLETIRRLGAASAAQAVRPPSRRGSDEPVNASRSKTWSA